LKLLKLAAITAGVCWALVAVAGTGAGAAPGLHLPGVPGAGRGVYRGAWVANGSGETDAALTGFQQQVGPLAIVHDYSAFKTALPSSQLDLIASLGAIPLLDWGGCGEHPFAGQDAAIVAGKEDTVIYDYAKGLLAFGKPVFLRYFWEMNLSVHAACAALPPNPSPPTLTPAQLYQEAWVRIWKIFHGQLEPKGEPPVDATNVAFVWCPDANGGVGSLAAWYPGSPYVDWIAADGYSHPPNDPSFTQVFGSWYAWAKNQGKPLMVGETGAGSTAADSGTVQATYLEGAASAILSGGPMDDIQAFVYFDSAGHNTKYPMLDWTLVGPGLTAFDELRYEFYYPAGHQPPVPPKVKLPGCGGTACI
jgi:hypothetical protein